MARRTRADGERSRERILDAAAEIAAERGYEGTSMALVSAKSGLPASSIYWHFTNKDDLIAAVIERSFGIWLAAWQIPREGVAEDRATDVAVQVAEALQDSPDFIRLGLMLALERRPEEPRARTMFLQVREQALVQLREGFAALWPELTKIEVAQLATYAMAGADGLFVSKELGGDAVDLIEQFKMHARAITTFVGTLLEDGRTHDPE